MADRRQARSGAILLFLDMAPDLFRCTVLLSSADRSLIDACQKRSVSVGNARNEQGQREMTKRDTAACMDHIPLKSRLFMVAQYDCQKFLFAFLQSS